MPKKKLNKSDISSKREESRSIMTIHIRISKYKTLDEEKKNSVPNWNNETEAPNHESEG